MSLQKPSIRTAFIPHLPYLRRYARALAGSQVSGDHFVRAALEALLASPATLDLNLSAPRRTLFQIFHAFWGPHRENVAMSMPGTVGEMTLTGREALLLTAVEGFTIDDTALILNTDVEAVAAEVANARGRISTEPRFRVLIIEDEPIIAMHLEQIVEEMGHEVIAIAMTHAEALEAISHSTPELVLADVQLADGSSGIDAVNDIVKKFNVPVIFITAYPERLLTGERPEPTYLVSKPFAADTVVATVGQALLGLIDKA